MLDSWYTKLQYLIAYYKYDVEKIIELSKIVNERYPKIIGFATQMAEIEDEHVYCMDWHYDEMFGDVDHQSMDNIDNLIKAMRASDEYKSLSTKKILQKIIFSNEFVIVTDSDEEYTLKSWFRNGILEKRNIKKILNYVSKDKGKTYSYILEDIENYDTSDDV